MPTEATLRPVQKSDVPAVVALVTDVLAEYGLRFGQGATTDDDVALLPESYEDAGGAFWVVVGAGGEVIATCGVFRVAAGTFELRKMYLHPFARGRGLGRRMLEEAIGWTRAHGGRRMVLDTTDQMGRAIAFYEANGFARDDREIRGARCSRGYARDL